ncbi:MAG: nucleotidyltransferase family protein [Oculatellaceae cyanobacterium Prado106]|jgi:hypothetical protein|nr:nucleotidyltransferase family protein [Oculatellaceae cyanobacterium Prado106]
MKTQTSLEVEQILVDRRSQILEIAHKHGAKNVRVFGSVVRGEATPESDIDFLVDLSENLSPWFPTGLIHELEDLLHHKVDIVTERTLHAFIRDRVLQEAKPL